MEKKDISRRELLQGTGALVVGFSLLGDSPALAQEQIAGMQGVPDGMASFPYANPDYLDPRSLDSWRSLGHVWGKSSARSSIVGPTRTRPSPGCETT